MDHSSARKPLYKSLYFQVITAIVIGVILGNFFPSTGEAMKPLGDGFIKLIKMIIAPIIFCTVVVGIAGMEDMKKVGKTGGYRASVFRGSSAAIALVVGLDDREYRAARSVGMNVDVRRRSIPSRHSGIHQAPAQMTSHDGLHPEHHSEHRSSTRSRRGEILQVLLIRSAVRLLRSTSLAGAARLCSISSKSCRTCCSAIVGVHHESCTDRRLWRDGVHHRQVRTWARSCR